ncbi:MAG TPA: hypothetical protein VJ785_11590 [Anaerolineales bacterium]|nr:hypothetical protein [Anaerolineales bacterium]
MQRWMLFPVTLILALLMVGCASIGNTQPSNMKSLEDYRMPTDVPSAAYMTETAEAEIAARTPPKDCPVTVPRDPLFIPPPPYSKMSTEEYFWYGSNSLWVSLPQDGVWSGLPHDSHGYSQKLPWWREGYVWDEEPEPALIVSGERLDAEDSPLVASTANGAYADEFGSAMLTGVDLPTLGCWKITGKYKDAELSFVVWVAP